MKTFHRYRLFFALLCGALINVSYAQQNGESKDGAILSDTIIHQKGPISTINSVPEQILTDAIRAKRVTDFKKDLVKSSGFIFGSDYILMPQVFSHSWQGPTNSTAGVFRVFGHWTPSKKMKQGAGKIVFKLDHRHKIDSDVPTNLLAAEAGIATSTAPVFNADGFLLTNLYWTQSLFDNKFSYRLGVVDATEYADLSILMNAYTEFSDIAFSFNPTFVIPKQGLGALLRYSITPNYYVMAGMTDLNSDPHKLNFFETFGKGEYLSHFSIGRVSSYDERRENNTNVVFWYANRNGYSGEDSRWGLAFNYSQVVGQWEPFVKFGYSEDGLIDISASAGIGYHLNKRTDKDFFAFGANYGRVPATDRDQFLFETYYRIQVNHILQVAPHIHYFINPALDVDTSHLYMLSVKMRVSI